MPLIQLFFDICRFHKGPQDTPASWFLLGLAVAVNLAVGVGIALMEIDLGQALVQTALGVVLMGVFFWVALALAGKNPRLLQTATAAFGCDTFISITALPLLILGQIEPDFKSDISFLLLLMLLWQIAVIGHILRHALSLPYISGFLIALAYTVMSYQTLMMLFPVAE